MAPRLRTQLIAPQESTQWISYEPPGNLSPILLLCSKPLCCTFTPAGKFYNGRSQQLLMRGPSATTRVSLTQRSGLTAQQFS